MEREEALALVKRNYWKAACTSLNEIARGAYVVADMDGSLRLFDGKRTVPLEQIQRKYPEAWKRTENERWGICP